MPRVVYNASGGGVLSCATSHVFVSAGWIGRTGSAGGGSGRGGPAHHSALINNQHQPINGVFILVRYRSRLLAWV